MSNDLSDEIPLLPPEKPVEEADTLTKRLLPEKTFPWPGCSNLCVNITMMGVETLKPRLIETVLGEDPPILLKATEAADEERQERAEAFLNWQAQTQMDLAPKVLESAHRYLLPGTVYAKTRWRLDERRVQAVRVFPSDTALDVILDAVLDQDVPLKTEEVAGGTFPSWNITVRTPAASSWLLSPPGVSPRISNSTASS